jgi:hypothetical protein
VTVWLRPELSAPGNPSKECEDLAASQPLAHYTAHLVDHMNLEDTLCQIKTNCCNIAHGWLPLLVISNDHHPGTSMPSGGHPPHQLATSFIFHRVSTGGLPQKKRPQHGGELRPLKSELPVPGTGTNIKLPNQTIVPANPMVDFG